MSEDFLPYQQLCASLVRRFLRAGLEREDLEQIAALGLLKALRCYRSSYGVPFMHYAWRTICGELLHFVRDHEYLVRMPRKVWELARRERASAERFGHEHGREPRAADIARELHASEHDISLLRSGLQFTSFDDEHAAVAGDLEERFLLRDALQELPEDERVMLVGVYICGYSQREIGEKIGYAQRQASRLHARALRRFAALMREVYS